MRKKFIQREETRYANNEFDNMPSIDYGAKLSDYLCAKNKNRVDMDKAKEICAKYGFGCTYINSTFGGDDADFVVYFKTRIDADYHQRLMDSAYGKDNNRSDAQKLRDIWNGHKDIYLKLHECVHELDEQTCLMFDCGWAGNCGLFGSDDVKRKSYNFGDIIYGWKAITDTWSPLIHDIKFRLTKGVYVLMSTRHIKSEIQDTPELDDNIEQYLLGLVKKYLSKDYTAGFEVGKRQYDNKPYKALVIRYKSGGYCKMITFSRDWTGRYNIKTSRPLCGESQWRMDWENPKDDIVSALGDCSIYAE